MDHVHVPVFGAHPQLLLGPIVWGPSYSRYAWRRRALLAPATSDSIAFNHATSALADFTGHVSDSGEGRCTLKAAIDEGVPAPVLSSALAQRLSSRGEGDFANKLLCALRYQFGGYDEKQ